MSPARQWAAVAVAAAGRGRLLRLRAAAGIFANTQLSAPGAGQRTTASAAALSIAITQPLTA